MSRLGSFILILALLALIVIAFDPNARQRAAALIDRWNDEIVVDREPDVDDDDDVVVVTPVPTRTPFPTATADLDDDDDIIPNTGGDDDDLEDSSDEPIIQINWDALEDALQRFWDRIKNIRVDPNPADN